MEFTEADVALIRKTVAQDASEADLEMFVYACKKTGLDPLMRQIHMVIRGKGEKRRAVIMAGIDGYRLIAARTGEYAGNEAAQFHALDEQHPVEATITVWRMIQGVRCPFTATARWFEYAPDGIGDFMWQKMPFTMLGKVAEALALRKAFPAELSGVYAEEEMAQADNAPRPVAAIPQRTGIRMEQSAPADVSIDPEGSVTAHRPTSQEAPRGGSVACRQCGYRPMLESKFEKGKFYHYTGEKDAKGKELTHTQSAAAPARAPEAKTGVVEGTSRPSVAVGGTPDPKNMGEVAQLAKDLYGIGFADLLKTFNVKSLDKVTMAVPDAWLFVKEYAAKLPHEANEPNLFEKE